MLIDKIVLNNYRVYEGTNTILFDYDHERNITIISGNNGFGKTSFLTSLIWCLYGKLMADVDEKYKREIFESGGYKKYCEKTINRNFLRQISTDALIATPAFSVTLVLSKVLIPGIPCDNIEITRQYNFITGSETLEILMDDRDNELAREMGPEIFINDFILPREIAKFFFFDAEKIVALAEMRSVEEKRQLGKAYAEVLGIKKYEDLKNNLENIRMKLRKSSNSENDENQINQLKEAIRNNERLLHAYKEKVDELRENIDRKKIEADKLQERLIREGSTITVEELKGLRKVRENAVEESKHLKSKVNELLDFAPFGIASRKLLAVYNQMMSEAEVEDQKMSNNFLKRKLSNIKQEIATQKKALNIYKDNEIKLYEILEKHLLPQTDSKGVKQLLNFDADEWNRLLGIVDNLKSSYGKRLKEVSTQLKINQSTYSIVNNRLRDAETKETDFIIQEIRKEKDKCDEDIRQFEIQLIETEAKLINLKNEDASIKKTESELTRKIKVEEVDNLKDKHASRLIDELTTFTKNLKNQKKKSLEANILDALRKLMHKVDFINRVEVIVGDDFMDIELYDNEGGLINKEGLSKGEQQLYATSILKALVDESNIKFPLFIDSPLQKFDKQHAHNIVTEFYPTISEQVILFPLLEKELSVEEYSWLLQKVNKVFLIEHRSQYSSGLKEIKPELLFESNISIA